jgi:plastocyanin
MSMRTIPWRRKAAWLGVGTAAVVAVACFSERNTPSGTEAGMACQVPENADVDGSTIVFIRDYGFHPATVRVKRGSRLTWVNCESTPGLSHTSTADAGAWRSQLISPAAAFTTAVDVAGTFTYHCEPHPFMTGTVVVE